MLGLNGTDGRDGEKGMKGDSGRMGAPGKTVSVQTHTTRPLFTYSAHTRLYLEMACVLCTFIHMYCMLGIIICILCTVLRKAMLHLESESLLCSPAGSSWSRRPRGNGR